MWPFPSNNNNKSADRRVVQTSAERASWIFNAQRRWLEVLTWRALMRNWRAALPYFYWLPWEMERSWRILVCVHIELYGVRYLVYWRLYVTGANIRSTLCMNISKFSIVPSYVTQYIVVLPLIPYIRVHLKNVYRIPIWHTMWTHPFEKTRKWLYPFSILFLFLTITTDTRWMYPIMLTYRR